MASPQVDSWWSNWLDAHGRDSEEEAAFLGFLSQRGIAAHGDADQLDGAYTDFKAFMEQSQATPSADPGPSAQHIGARMPVVPKSRIADPQVQRPSDDATHPQQMSSPGAPASPMQQEAAGQQEAAEPEEPPAPVQAKAPAQAKVPAPSSRQQKP